MKELENELLELIEEEFEAYISECDLDEGGWIDAEDFAKVAVEQIEQKHGKLRFDDFNIASYAIGKAKSIENNDDISDEVTHWMELPKPPSATADIAPVSSTPEAGNDVIEDGYNY